MKIGISAEWLGTRAGGPETYESNLIKTLATFKTTHQFHVYLSEKTELARYSRLAPHIVPLVMPGRSRWIVIPFSQPYEMLRHPVDLFHATFVAPPLCPAPFVLTVCELGFEKHPEYYPRMMARRLSWLTRWGTKRARVILSISEYTKQELIECYGIPQEKILVNYWGVSERFRPISDPETVRAAREKYGLTNDYILYVGKVEARKNLSRLIRAYHILRLETRAVQDLVILGMWSYLNQDVEATVREVGREDSIRFLPAVDRQDLPALYNGASVFVFPSLLEAFGIPPIEAMACGVPVVVSKATAIPEIVGDAGVYVDPMDAHSIAEGLDQALTDAVLRRDLRQKGLIRARQFSWETTVHQTLQAYERATG